MKKVLYNKETNMEQIKKFWGSLPKPTQYLVLFVGAVVLIDLVNNIFA